MDKVVNILSYFEEGTKSISKTTAVLSGTIQLINILQRVLQQNIKDRYSQYFAQGNVPEFMAVDMIFALSKTFHYLDNHESFYYRNGSAL